MSCRYPFWQLRNSDLQQPVPGTNHPQVLLVVDAPNWAHDFKSRNLVRCLGSDFDLRLRYQEQVVESELDEADLVLVYHWRQIRKLAHLAQAFERNRTKLLVGICSHFEMMGDLREPGLRILNTLPRAVFLNSLQLYHEFTELLSVPCFYTPNGVDTHFYTPGETRDRTGPLRVGWAGSLKNHGDKRGYHDLIVPAVQAVPGVELVTAAREDHWRSPQELRAFYRSLDLYLCASRSEGTPNPCLEAAACGVPIITTRVGNMPELIEDGVNGILIERDVHGLSAVLRQMAQQPARLEEMGRRILQSIRDWDWHIQAQNYRFLFKASLESSSLESRGAPERSPGFRRRLKILYLCSRHTFDTKMSRVRFHSMEAIGRIADLLWSGPGWSNYDDTLTVQENIDRLYGLDTAPDLVVAYKPLGMGEFGAVKAPKCIRYNEMYDQAWTDKEIEASGADLVICHHRNDLEEYAARYQGTAAERVQLSHIAHCADPRFYTDYGLPKTIDLLLIGARGIRTLLGAHYPLRDRLERLLPQLAHKYRVEIQPHPGAELSDATSDRNTVEFARTINSAKICLTCSGVPRSRFGKYIEVPMCGTALAADLPDEDREFFEKFVIELNMSMSDDEILNKLEYYLTHDAEREALARRGQELARDYTQERYAERFVDLAWEFLEGTHVEARSTDLSVLPEGAVLVISIEDPYGLNLVLSARPGKLIWTTQTLAAIQGFQSLVERMLECSDAARLARQLSQESSDFLQRWSRELLEEPWARSQTAYTQLKQVLLTTPNLVLPFDPQRQDIRCLAGSGRELVLHVGTNDLRDPTLFRQRCDAGRRSFGGDRLWIAHGIHGIRQLTGAAAAEPASEERGDLLPSRFQTDYRYVDRATKPRYVWEKYHPVLRGSILDVGADGSQMKSALPADCEYVGIGFGTPPTIQVDLEHEDLPYGTGSFECVLCMDVLEHLDNIHRVFDELCRVTRRYVIIALPNPYAAFWTMLRTGAYRPGTTLKFYGLPGDPPEDRHKWFFHIGEAEEFIRHRAKLNKMEILQMDYQGEDREKDWRRLHDELCRRGLVHGDLDPRALFAGSIWALLRKQS